MDCQTDTLQDKTSGSFVVLPWKIASLLLLSLILHGCSSFFYYPTRHLYVDPQRLHPKPTEVQFSSATGESITAWHFDAKPNSSPKAVILFFHGNAQNISSHFMSLYWITPYNIDFLIFDYPGYGGSSGEPSPQNTVAAGHAAFEWLRINFPQIPVAVYGQSLGGIVALKAMTEIPSKSKPCLITVESSFSSYQKIARDVLSRSWFTWMFQPFAYIVISDRFAPHKSLQALSPTPLIVIHGDKDNIIDIQHGQEIFSQAVEPKEFWLVRDGQHIDAFSGPHKAEMQRRYLDALKKYCTI